MVFIPKAALRYVSLTSFLLKTLEKLVDHPIRVGRSTNTALYQLLKKPFAGPCKVMRLPSVPFWISWRPLAIRLTKLSSKTSRPHPPWWILQFFLQLVERGQDYADDIVIITK